MDADATFAVVATIIISLLVNGPTWLAMRQASVKAKADAILEKAELTSAQLKAKVDAENSSINLESTLTDTVLKRFGDENARLNKRVLDLETANTLARELRHKSEDENELIRQALATLQNTDRDREQGYIVVQHSLIDANMQIANLKSEIEGLKNKIATLEIAISIRDKRIAELEGKQAPPPGAGTA